MAIEPNSTIQFFGDVGLKPNQEDTIYFPDESTKTGWFNNKTMLGNFTNQYYSRRGRGKVRVAPPNGAGIGALYNAQYMRFKNTSYENKWFYAFVTSVDYINDTVVEVNYDIDIMVTWMGCFNLLECYVVRNHVSNDAIGSNTVDENLDIGEYVCEKTHVTSFFGSYKVGVWRSYDPLLDVALYPIKQGTYVPIIANFYALTTAGIDALNTLLWTTLASQNRVDSIITMKLVPEHYAVNNNDTYLGDATPITDNFTVEKPYSYYFADYNSSGNSKRYSPKNKKLFTYPYKYLSVENCEGGNVTFKYEYFNTFPPYTSSNLNCSFIITGSAVTPEVNIMCIPHNYLFKEEDYSNAVEMTKFPNVCWNVDTYKAYLAQRDSTIVGDVIGSSLTAGVSGMLASGFNPAVGATGALIGALSGVARSGLISDITNELAGQSKYVMPNETKGKANADLMVQNKDKNFIFREMCITTERARMIDDYFTMFGYAIKKVQTPLMNLRPHFTYVKTIGCNIEPKSGYSIPGSDASAIEDMFNNGKRFWTRTSKVGDYSQDNRIPS